MGTQYNNSFFFFVPNRMRFLVALPFALAVLAFLLKHASQRLRKDANLAVVLLGAGSVLMFATSRHELDFLTPMIGRDSGRSAALILVGSALGTAVFVDSILTRNLHTTLIPVVTGLALICTFPFLTGLESQRLPSQPALTLRPIPVPQDYVPAYEAASAAVAPDSTSITFIPGKALVRVSDEAGRFENPFHSVASSSTHFPLPATWNASDKVPAILRKYEALRGAILTSGDISLLETLMRRENSNVLVFDLRSMSVADEASLKAVESSPEFEQLLKPRNGYPFRVFTLTNRQDRVGTVTTPLRFLGGNRSLIGAFIAVCTDEKRSTSIPTAFSFSKYWQASVSLSSQACVGTKNRNAIDRGRSLSPKAHVVNEPSGLMRIEISGQRSSSEALRVKVAFRPALLQARLFLLFFVLYLATLVFFVIRRTGTIASKVSARSSRRRVQ